MRSGYRVTAGKYRSAVLHGGVIGVYHRFVCWHRIVRLVRAWGERGERRMGARAWWFLSSRNIQQRWCLRVVSRETDLRRRELNRASECRTLSRQVV